MNEPQELPAEEAHITPEEGLRPPPVEPQKTPLPVEPPSNGSGAPPPRTGRPLPTWAVLLFLAGLLIVVAVGVWMLMQNWPSSSPESGAGTLVVDKRSTFLSPPDLPEDQLVLQENGTPLPAVLPVTLEVGGETDFPIVPVPLEEGRWPVPAEQEDVAVWVYGTVVNYVIGLPYARTTESLLGGLGTGDTITLTLGNGTTLLFGSPRAERYPTGDTEPLSQRSPGLTLVLLGGEDADRLVVQARYLPEESPTTEGPQRVGDLRIHLLDSGPVEGPGGESGFLVEFRVVNSTTMEVDPELFDMVLQDGADQRYAVNPTITALGEHNMLALPLPPGSSVAGSAGYMVPEDLTPPLTWIFRPDPASTEAARFSLPYEPPMAGPPVPQVTLSEAFADERRGVIVINGMVSNSGESPLPVTQEYVVLTSSAGEAPLRASTPVLPWSVPPGGEQLFELQFARPQDVDSVLLDFWGFTFEIEGLP